MLPLLPWYLETLQEDLDEEHVVAVDFQGQVCGTVGTEMDDWVAYGTDGLGSDQGHGVLVQKRILKVLGPFAPKGVSSQVD